MTRHEKDLRIRELRDEDRDDIAGWTYPGDLQIYNPGPDALALRPPDHVALVDANGALVGYGSLGSEAQVPGGTYPDDNSTVDLGIGLRPSLVGQGHGASALEALAAEACAGGSVLRLRVTVAAENRRASALVAKLGFRATHRFTRGRDGRAFVQYERYGSTSTPRQNAT